MISCKDVVKKFGSFEAVAGVSLEVQAGEIFGLLGPNGAGKSTLIRMLYGSTHRSAGEMNVLGFDPMLNYQKLRARIGVVPQENCLDESLTVKENLSIYCRYHAMDAQLAADRIDQYLKLFSLEKKASAIIKTLSGGMQRRLSFVRALLPDPDLLILDEPTTGLDPAVRQLLWEKIKEVNARGKTVLITTHYMEEAERLCQRLVIVDRGKIAAMGTPSDLKAATDGAKNFEDVFLHVTGRRLDVDE